MLLVYGEQWAEMTKIVVKAFFLIVSACDSEVLFTRLGIIMKVEGHVPGRPIW